MKNNKIRFLLSTLLVSILASSFAIAEAFKVEITKPEIVEITSPDLGGDSAKKSYKPKDWMEIELKFKIESSNKEKLFADKVVVKWYVATKNPDPSGKGFVMLEKEITHVNVPIDEDVYVSVYLSPNSIKRLTGNERVTKADIKDVGGEITIEGQQPMGSKKGYFTMSSKAGWWTSGSLSRYDKIPLLNKSETPFKMLWYDRYAEIEEKR